MDWHSIDLHGQPPDRGRIGWLLRQALADARRRHAGLLVIHGRGQHVLAAIAQSLLREWNLEFVEGWMNPGETRVSAAVVQAFRER